MWSEEFAKIILLIDCFVVVVDLSMFFHHFCLELEILNVALIIHFSKCSIENYHIVEVKSELKPTKHVVVLYYFSLLQMNFLLVFLFELFVEVNLDMTTKLSCYQKVNLHSDDFKDFPSNDKLLHIFQNYLELIDFFEIVSFSLRSIPTVLLIFPY